jgi:hypothetical protein
VHFCAEVAASIRSLKYRCSADGENRRPCQPTMSTPKKSRNENEKRFQAEIAKKEKKLKRKSKQ